MRAQRLVKNANILHDTVARIQDWPIIKQILNWFYKNRMQSELTKRAPEIQGYQQKYQQGVTGLNSLSEKSKNPIYAAAITNYLNSDEAGRKSLAAKNPELAGLDSLPFGVNTRSTGYKNQPEYWKSKIGQIGTQVDYKTNQMGYPEMANVIKSPTAFDPKKYVGDMSFNQVDSGRKNWFDNWALKNRKPPAPVTP